MEYNPFVARLRTTDDEIEQLEHRRADLVDRLAWAGSFDPDVEADALARLSAELEECRTELTRLGQVGMELDAKSSSLASQTPGLERDARLVTRALRFFTPDQDDSQARLKVNRTGFDGGSGYLVSTSSPLPVS